MNFSDIALLSIKVQNCMLEYDSLYRSCSRRSARQSLHPFHYNGSIVSSKSIHEMESSVLNSSNVDTSTDDSSDETFPRNDSVKYFVVRGHKPLSLIIKRLNSNVTTYNSGLDTSDITNQEETLCDSEHKNNEKDTGEHSGKEEQSISNTTFIHESSNESGSLESTEEENLCFEKDETKCDEFSSKEVYIAQDCEVDSDEKDINTSSCENIITDSTECQNSVVCNESSEVVEDFENDFSNSVVSEVTDGAYVPTPYLHSTALPSFAENICPPIQPPLTPGMCSEGAIPPNLPPMSVMPISPVLPPVDCVYPMNCVYLPPDMNTVMPVVAPAANVWNSSFSASTIVVESSNNAGVLSGNKLTVSSYIDSQTNVCINSCSNIVQQHFPNTPSTLNPPNGISVINYSKTVQFCDFNLGTQNNGFNVPPVGLEGNIACPTLNGNIPPLSRNFNMADNIQYNQYDHPLQKLQTHPNIIEFTDHGSTPILDSSVHMRQGNTYVHGDPSYMAANSSIPCIEGLPSQTIEVNQYSDDSGSGNNLYFGNHLQSNEQGNFFNHNVILNKDPSASNNPAVLRDCDSERFSDNAANVTIPTNVLDEPDFQSDDESMSEIDKPLYIAEDSQLQNDDDDNFLPDSDKNISSKINVNEEKQLCSSPEQDFNKDHELYQSQDEQSPFESNQPCIDTGDHLSSSICNGTESLQGPSLIHNQLNESQNKNLLFMNKSIQSYEYVSYVSKSVQFVEYYGSPSGALSNQHLDNTQSPPIVKDETNDAEQYNSPIIGSSYVGYENQHIRNQGMEFNSYQESSSVDNHDMQPDENPDLGVKNDTFDDCSQLSESSSSSKMTQSNENEFETSESSQLLEVDECAQTGNLENETFTSIDMHMSEASERDSLSNSMYGSETNTSQDQSKKSSLDESSTNMWDEFSNTLQDEPSLQIEESRQSESFQGEQDGGNSNLACSKRKASPEPSTSNAPFSIFSAAKNMRTNESSDTAFISLPSFNSFARPSVFPNGNTLVPSENPPSSPSSCSNEMFIAEESSFSLNSSENGSNISKKDVTENNVDTVSQDVQRDEPLSPTSDTEDAVVSDNTSFFERQEELVYSNHESEDPGNSVDFNELSRTNSSSAIGAAVNGDTNIACVSDGVPDFAISEDTVTSVLHGGAEDREYQQHSPLLFGSDEEDSCSYDSKPSSSMEEPLVNICHMVSHVDSMRIFERMRLRRLRKLLMGVPPPPSVTVPQFQVLDILELLKENSDFMLHKDCEDATTTSVRLPKFTSSLTDAETTPWPKSRSIFYHGISYNNSKESEEFEYLCQKMAHRYIGSETSSTCVPTSRTPNSATKRKRRRRFGQSPGSRLSYLARRRYTFSSANLLKDANSTAKVNSEKRVIMVDTKKKNHRLSKSVSDNQKALQKASLQARVNSLKRALFVSPVSKDKEAQKNKNHVGALKEIMNQSLQNDELNCNGKRVLQNIDYVPPVKCRRNLFQVTSTENKDSEKQTSPDKMRNNHFKSKHKTDNTVNGFPHNRLSSSHSDGTVMNSVHKKKLLWAVAEALREVNITRHHSLFHRCATTLARRCRSQVMDLLRTRRERPGQSTSDCMLEVVRRFVHDVVNEIKKDDVT